MRRIEHFDIVVYCSSDLCKSNMTRHCSDAVVLTDLNDTQTWLCDSSSSSSRKARGRCLSFPVCLCCCCRLRWGAAAAAIASQPTACLMLPGCEASQIRAAAASRRVLPAGAAVCSWPCRLPSSAGCPADSAAWQEAGEGVRATSTTGSCSCSTCKLQQGTHRSHCGVQLPALGDSQVENNHDCVTPIMSFH